MRDRKRFVDAESLEEKIRGLSEYVSRRLIELGMTKFDIFDPSGGDVMEACGGATIVERFDRSVFQMLLSNRPTLLTILIGGHIERSGRCYTVVVPERSRFHEKQLSSRPVRDLIERCVKHMYPDARHVVIHVRKVW